MDFVDIFFKIGKGFRREWKASPINLNFLSEFATDLKNCSVLAWQDVMLIIAVALVMTLMRFVLTKSIFKPLSVKLGFTNPDKPKFCESSWKLMFYVVAMVWEFYLVIYKHPTFFTDPRTCWNDWHIGMDVTDGIYYLYMYECGFYVHAVFGTIYMDVWRRDSVAMIAHHVLTDALIIFSLAVRYHRIGLVVLVLHDAADVFLETTKLLTCFKNRTKNPGMLLEGSIGGGFITFALTWLVFRLYAYPKYVLLPGAVTAREVVPHGKFYYFFNGMLMMLFGLNVYWFHFIALLIYRIVSGQSRGVEDTREDEEDELNNQQAKKTNGVHKHQNGDATHQNGHAAHQNGKTHLITNGDTLHKNQNGNGITHRATNNNGFKH